MKITLTKHAKMMVGERKIDFLWIQETIDHPEQKILAEDGTIHYIRSIEDAENRTLHVVMREDVMARRVVTVFFDRRFAKKKGKI